MSYRGLCRIPGKTGLFDIEYSEGRITALKPVDHSAEQSDDLPWVSAGLFDIQVNGMVGVNLSDDNLTDEDVLKVEAALEQRTVSRWCPTITTQDFQVVKRNLKTLGDLIDQGKLPNVAGIHLEGHYISSEVGYRGVHMEKFIRDPDPAEMDEWYRAAGGRVCLFSLAPERTGAIDFIRILKKMGIKVGLVHHNADYETIRIAAAAGADLSTHLLNGCAKMIHRQHNVIWAQLALDELWASFIADGYHIPHYTLKSLIRAKGLSRSILVSDLAHLSGMPDGEYSKYGNTVVVKDGGLWVKGEGTDLLSGAVRTLDDDCAFLVNHAGFSLESALTMASINPARYFGVEQSMNLHEGRAGKLFSYQWKDNKLIARRL